MSTPSIAARPHQHRARDTARGERITLRRLIRGRETAPAWSRPALWLVALLAGVLMLWGLSRNGYANTYYAQAAQAASRSWTAWMTNAVDVSASDSLDKGPLSNMLMGLSGRLLGFSSFTMLLPEALCGVASVLLLHNTVRRSLGHRAAILAALILALTPIFVAMSRFNNPDALLVLSEVAAAWALVRALGSGRTRDVVLCGLFVGLAFNVKMLQAYLVVPGLAVSFLVAGRGGIRRRLAQLAAGAVAMIMTSFAWYGTMMLIPAAQRPWVGDTTDNSWFSLIFGANGLSRVSGAASDPGGGGGFGGEPGLLRLLNTAIGGQVAWLAPLAVCGLALGLWSRRGAPRRDLARSAYLLWGGWALVSWAVFSFSKGIFHPYYTTALAPVIAVLAAAGLIGLWDRSRRSALWSAVLAAAVIATSALAVLLLGRTGGFLPWLAPATLAMGVIAATALVLPHLMRGRPALRTQATLMRVALIAGLLAVLAGPASYSLATVGRSLSGSNPLAGPAGTSVDAGPAGVQRPGRGALAGLTLDASRSAASASFGMRRSLRLAALPGSLGATAPGARAATPGVMGAQTSKAMVKFLEAHQGNARYMVAAVGSSTSAGLALASGRNVIDIGGYAGSDPSPSLSQLQHLIKSGQLHYIVLGRGQGAGGVPTGVSSSATRARQRWIEGHGKVVRISGRSTSAMTLYYLPSAA